MSAEHAAGAPTGQAGRKARTRAALLAAGRRLFAERGLANTPIADITGEAELGFGTFYLHFASKAELLEAVVDDGMAELERTVAGAVVGTDDLLTRQRAALGAYLRFAHANGDLFRIMVEAAPSWAHLVQGFQRPFLDRIQASLTEGQAAGVVRKGNVELMANLVLATVRWAGLWWVNHDQPGPDEVADEVARFVQSGVAVNR